MALSPRRRHGGLRRRSALADIKTLASKDSHGRGTLRIQHANCPVAVITRPLETSAKGDTFYWQRPLVETARSTGGPLIACAQTTN